MSTEVSLDVAVEEVALCRTSMKAEDRTKLGCVPLMN